MSETQGYKVGTPVTGAMTAKTRAHVLFVLRMRVIDCHRKLKNAVDKVAEDHWKEEIEDAQAAIAELEAM